MSQDIEIYPTNLVIATIDILNAMIAKLEKEHGAGCLEVIKYQNAVSDLECALEDLLSDY